MSLFRCPLCASPLTRTDRTYTCPKGHSFDRSREGYVHLLPANQKHAKDPGDDKEMAAARNRFLSGGWYAPLREALCRLALTYAPAGAAALDAGCGEGYYTAGVYAALSETGQVGQMAGVDLSKPSLRWAARREKNVEFAVASVYHLPVADTSVDLLLNCFSPLALDEFRRVLRPGGVYLYVVPAARHLWELKEVLYDSPYLNKEEDIPYEGFSYLEVVPVETVLDLPDRDTIRDLFSMTPYRWKTPKAGAARLEELDRLTVTAAFRVHVFRRDPA
ncbi:putative RNA methyltransferase [uncultured Intestinimonas sp.]|uniref:putative RNA methyltransferase n=1 Tax=uncultured Intestinimonas sp. TaxID=1689265 RepID=UPI0025D9567B|nr:methyltransferase domain-containing protein [uncultured Intestinimonas sp.]